ncbi:MAG: rRNA maturation RNase YbeY [Candidatus Muproteobacteria bacterium RIFCSPHIGHO2_12_FULL_60_33]|uniref:Endoribonuclease YbeY n=1 Tax=Candidatus Muproteobacteria bacterium RIFCSPLOWO2_01_FULL_60_18 TaxID=1817768 RepID=A0A1F6U0I8_9PROT|nr:MAG: rRNA maturation RNase YbeY [Candidatus Muproteobacteria bacterium RIFCSPLOWO2_01_FULL_60_18]OGI55488.1 MAG: rRNA maturation RNase YbeY [Candidatus Muproteobacteria bacterium RIFCSPHIGHO2_12_FULL_60_33]OGI58883.1 MAG: rRNA maturation RNase YbeY [Candidatus Muproteobacteria bacterium RIFCSPHIGHO2_01_FULL_61_200]
MKLQLSVQYGAARAGLPATSTIRRWARAALHGLRHQRIALGVRIVEAAESAFLNHRFRHQRGPTNVLSFPFEAPSGTRSELLGDLVICAPVVRREAREQQKPLRAHWAHMVVHGILHLRGYDHLNRRDATAMEKKEIRILKELGFANPYLS